MGIKNNQTAILDSSGLFSLLIESDSNHLPALAALEHSHSSHVLLVIPSDVFSETINIIGKKFNHQKALDIAHLLLASSDFLLTNEMDSYSSAMKKFNTASESVSFTDCVVMATADTYQTTFIFGFDKIFKQSGYSLPQ